MPIRFECPVCGFHIKAPDGTFGRRGTCPSCKTMIRVPSQEGLANKTKAGAPPVDDWDISPSPSGSSS